MLVIGLFLAIYGPYGVAKPLFKVRHGASLGFILSVPAGMPAERRFKTRRFRQCSIYGRMADLHPLRQVI